MLRWLSFFAAPVFLVAMSPSYASDCGPFLKALGEQTWTVDKVQSRINRAEAYSENFQIPAHRIRQYEADTGIQFEMNMTEDLFQFLKRKNLDPHKLEHIGGGVQGSLYKHPDYPGKAFKISNIAVNPMLASYRLRTLPGSSQIQIPDASLPVPEAVRKNQFIASREAEEEARIQRGAGRTILRYASQLMELRMLFHELHMPYFDVVKIHAVGSYFYVRDFAEDGAVDDEMMPNAWKVAETHGFDLGAKINPLLPVIAQHPGLSTILHYTVLGLPQSYSSASEFAATKGSERPRLFVIYDLD